MTGFEKYSMIFVQRAKELIHEENLTNNPDYREVLINQLFGLSGPKRISRKQTPDEVSFSRLFAGFTEIHTSYYSLLDIEVYLRRFPYPNTNVSKTRYLAYHIENYLNEVYILKERLNSYCALIVRLYRKDQTLKNLNNTITELSSIVQKSLKGITDTRGNHVHRSRFSDEDFDRLRSLELFNLGSKEIPLLRVLYNDAFKTTRKKYREFVTHNNKEIRKIINVYFDVLYTIVADNRGSVRYPSARAEQPTHALD
jgi:uncharacterized protein YlaN (UPF0358 family)